MTVSVQTPFIQYSGDNSTTSFVIPFYFQNSSDIVVKVNGVVKVQGTDYSVTGAGTPTGGHAIFVTAPANSTLVDIGLVPSLDQSQDIENYQTLLEGVLMTALDKLSLTGQYFKQLLNQAMQYDRSIATPTWIGLGKEITNIAAGTSSTSAARVDQITSIVAAAGNVPAPLTGDAGKALSAVSAGVFSWKECKGALLAIVEEQQNSGTGGGTSVATTFTNRVLNVKTYDRHSTIGLASNVITLPAGDFEVEWETNFNLADVAVSRLFDPTFNSVVAMGTACKATTNASGQKSTGRAFITTSGKTICVQYYCGSAVANGLGAPVSSGGVETYTRLTVRAA